jgi:hypothetical protein
MSDENKMAEAAKEVSKIGVIQMLEVAQAVGVSQGMVLACTVAAGIGSLYAAGANDEQIGLLVAEGKRAAGEVNLRRAAPGGDA